MKFVLMIMTDERANAARTPNEIEGIVAAHVAFSRELGEAGKLLASERLRFSPEAITVRERSGDALIVDGPFTESKEVFGGFYLIEAASREEAVAWAKKLPLQETGAVEVRPARTGATWRGTIRGARKFALLLVADSGRVAARQDVFRAIDAHYELSLELASRGQFVSSRSLEPPDSAATLRWKDGGPIVSDGPFAETKEFVAGYFVIACDERSEAVAWAQRLMLGSAACEVRPVWQ